MSTTASGADVGDDAASTTDAVLTDARVDAGSIDAASSGDATLTDANADAGSADGNAGSTDASADTGIPPADGPFGCGTSTCSATQFCVQQCACGGELRCDPPDGSACPLGETLVGSCCTIPCSNPPPSCMDTPSVCPVPVSGGRFVDCPCPG